MNPIQYSLLEAPFRNTINEFRKPWGHDEIQNYNLVM
ncbi:hypothetical protein EC843_1212 [Buttiauxella sp. JUb87]|nr:hypothetical protein EC843_1212 [Buttiauxella sp. JUb87]